MIAPAADAPSRGKARKPNVASAAPRKNGKSSLVGAQVADELERPVQQPRPVRPALRALMEGKCPEEPRPFTKAEREAAQRAVDLIECNLCHFEGKHAGKPFLLEVWQEKIIRRMFGRLNAHGLRQYRTVYIEVPRKNGKSTLAAAIAILLVALDGEAGAQVFSAARDRAMARIVFRTAAQMVQNSPALRERLLVFKNTIETPDEQCIYKALPADAEGLHGLNVHGAVIDEVHTLPNRDLWDVLVTATGAREQPLVVAITTAGYDRHSICWELHEYARKVIDGKHEDNSFLGVIYGADTSDDWTSPETWKKANPNLGVSVSIEFLASECERAKVSSAYENTFRRLYLNQWTSQENRFIPMARWRECSLPVDPFALRGQVCYAGLDLSSAVDVTAFVMVFPDAAGDYQIVPHFFLPLEGLQERSVREGVPWSQWADDGWIHATPGEVIDYSIVRQTIVEASKLYKLKEVAFDRWGAGQISQEIDSMGITILPFGQGFGSMSNPTKALLEKVIGKRIRHGGNPVLEWMAECTNVAQDPAGNIKPVKPDRRKNASRIDGIVALIMALDRAMRHVAAQIGGPKGRSVYEGRGLVTL